LAGVGSKQTIVEAQYAATDQSACHAETVAIIAVDASRLQPRIFRIS
jgi:hypothetical protein